MSVQILEHDVCGVIPAASGWWAIYTSEWSGEASWYGRAVIAWQPLQNVTHGNGLLNHLTTTLIPVVWGGFGEGYAESEEVESLIALLHESEMTAEVRAKLAFATPDILDRHAQDRLERLRRIAKAGA